MRINRPFSIFLSSVVHLPSFNSTLLQHPSSITKNFTRARCLWVNVNARTSASRRRNCLDSVGDFRFRLPGTFYPIFASFLLSILTSFTASYLWLTWTPFHLIAWLSRVICVPVELLPFYYRLKFSVYWKLRPTCDHIILECRRCVCQKYSNGDFLFLSV